MGIAPGRHARRTSPATVISLTISFAIAFAAIVAAVLMHLADTAAPTARPAPAPAVNATQPVTQEGRLVSVTPDSLTAQSADGVSRTYLVNDQTHGITAAGSQIGSTATAFAVNDEVSIIGVARGGDNLATTVVHRQAAELNGPPMDYALP